MVYLLLVTFYVYIYIYIYTYISYFKTHYVLYMRPLPRLAGAEGRGPNRVEPGNSIFRTEPNRTDELSKSPMIIVIIVMIIIIIAIIIVMMIIIMIIARSCPAW